VECVLHTLVSLPIGTSRGKSESVAKERGEHVCQTVPNEMTCFLI